MPFKQQKPKSSSKAEFGTVWKRLYFPAEAFTDSSKHFPTQTNLLAEHGWAWLSGAVFLPRSSGHSWTQISLSASVKSRFTQAAGGLGSPLITEQGPALCSLSTLLILPTFLLAVVFARMLVRSQNERRQKIQMEIAGDFKHNMGLPNPHATSSHRAMPKTKGRKELHPPNPTWM